MNSLFRNTNSVKKSIHIQIHPLSKFLFMHVSYSIYNCCKNLNPSFFSFLTLQCVMQWISLGLKEVVSDLD